MKNFTRILCLLMVLAMVFPTAGCGKDPAGKEPAFNALDGLTAEDFGCSNTYPAVDLSDYTNYYVDAVAGNDSNDGKSEQSPKKTLASVEPIAAAATKDNPVRILLKRGVTFSGNWHLSGYETTAEKPLIIDAYGAGNDRPVIIGYGTDSYSDKDCAAILVQDDNVRIFNLEITGKTAYQGIYVFPREGGLFENIVIENCYVHDINFNWIYNTEPRNTSPDDIDVEVVCPQVRASHGDNFGRYVYRKYSAICIYPDRKLTPTWVENVWILGTGNALL